MLVWWTIPGRLLDTAGTRLERGYTDVLDQTDKEFLPQRLSIYTQELKAMYLWEHSAIGPYPLTHNDAIWCDWNDIFQQRYPWAWVLVYWPKSNDLLILMLWLNTLIALRTVSKASWACPSQSVYSIFASSSKPYTVWKLSLKDDGTQYSALMFHKPWKHGSWQCHMAYGCSGLCGRPIMCRVITMFRLAWMCRWSVLAGVSWHIYAGCNSVPCGMDVQMVACVPKNTLDVWIP